MRRLFLYLFFVGIFFKCTTESPTEKQADSFFYQGELSKDDFIDSVSRTRYTSILGQLNEKPLRDLSNNIRSFRVVVNSSIYNPYCIRIEREDSLTRVVIKVGSDRKGFIRAGLNNLALSYESRHQRMDSIWLALSSAFNEYDFYPGLDEIEYVSTDGTPFIVESFSPKGYRVVRGKVEGPYKGQEQLTDLVRKMESLVPGDLLPNLASARELEDVLFTVFKADSRLTRPVE